MKVDRSWSLELKPIYDEPERYDDGLLYSFVGPVTLSAVRVAVKSGSREVLVFSAVRPEADAYVFSYQTMVPDLDDNPHNLDFSPFKQLIDDAELGRRVREAGLELK